MRRKKVKLAFISNDSARKATFKKRKKGLIKKVHELSTLCDIDACAIIYSPYESQPEVWPNNIGAQQVLAQFMRMPDMEKSKKMMNQESFIKQRITKANEQLRKQVNDNKDKEMTEVMYQCLTGKGSIANLTLTDLNDLGGLVDQTLNVIFRRIESLKTVVPASTSSNNNMSTAVDGMQRTQWFTDWINNPSGLGYEMTPFVDNPNPIWPNPYFL